jgi:hypothetical protein
MRNKTCSSCKVQKSIDKFMDSKGKVYKTCSSCRTAKARYQGRSATRLGSFQMSKSAIPDWMNDANMCPMG